MADTAKPQASATAPKEDDQAKDAAKGTKAAANGGSEAGNTDAVALLTADHRKVDELSKQFEKAKTRSQKQGLAEQMCTALKIHAMLEEELFYPAVRQRAEDDSMLDEAQVEHDTVKLLITAIESDQPAGEYFEAKVKVLSEYVKHHVSEEEGPDGIFAQARKAGVDLAALGRQMAQRKQELSGDLASVESEPVSLQTTMSKKKENATMRSSSNGSRDRGRDDQGRFTSDRDEGYRSRGSSRYDDDDDDYRRSSSRRRDDDDDDDRRYSSRSGNGNGGDRGSDRGSDRGQGGWFGDSRGHSEAARRGWEDRGSSSRGGRDDDDDRGRGGSRSGRGRDDDDDRGRSSSRMSGRGRDDDDGRGHGRGGWFGDSEGHSEAARRGWDDRGRSSSSSRGGRDDDYDDRGRGGSRMSGRGRDDDDGRGRGGWFGDPRGHSEAARRGWEDRR